jgi:NADPH-dependent 2,4-dienoyl-CoA reductase/sulfur reductase-like enzyme
MTAVECLVVGGGPAGLAAAVTAAAAGLRVTLADENPELGGQYYRQMPSTFEAREPARLAPEYREGRSLIDAVRAQGVDLRMDTVVWGLFDGRTAALASRDRTEFVAAETLILASGAYDRPVPFPGWTLPGVLSAGGAQNLMKGYGVLPGRRVLVAGSGPLLLVVAHYLLAGGARVVALCEAASLEGAWREAWRLVPHLNLVQQGYRYWRELRAAGVPVLWGHIIRRAVGHHEVTAAAISRCDAHWRPIPSSERTYDVDTLVVGYGFVSSVELTRLAGCEHQYRADLDSWVPVRNDDLETTVPGVYAIGDGAAVAGSAVALEEGRLAGLAAAWRLGKLPERQWRRRRARARARLRHLAGFRGVMDRLYRIRPALYTLADHDTILCRCEELTIDDARALIAEGACQLNEVKALTRIGMGRCQGRLCGPTVAHLIAQETGRLVPEAGVFTARPPTKPVPLAALTHRC